MGWGKWGIVLFFFCRGAWGALALDVGAYATHLEDRFYVPEEFRPKVSHLSGFLRLRPILSLGRRWAFEPALGLLLPWRSGADGNVKLFTAHFDLGLSFRPFSFISLRVGPGVQWIGILSSGQAVELNNGSASNTSTFYTPGKFGSGFLFTVQGALAVHFSSRLSLSFELYVANASNSLRRAVDGLVAVGFVL